MSHDHSKISSTSNFALVFFINLTFTLVEIVGGYLTNSISIWADALHDLGDTFSLGLTWRLEKISTRKSDGKFSFGYRRFSLLGAFINGSFLCLGSIFILFQAVPRLFHLENVHSEGMFGLAILGILVNGFAAYRLHNKKTISESMLSLHLLEDVLGWVLVLIVSIAIKFGDLIILDPILSILLAAFIVYNAIKRIKKTVMIFLQSIPPEIDMNYINKCLCDLVNIKNIHDTHLWSLDGNYHVLSMHVTVDANTSKQEALQIKCQIKDKMHELGIAHTTLEIEYEDEHCPNPNC